MPPRVKITKEDIVNAAVDIARRGGAQAINARNVAAELQCSTQPVFSNFATMEDLYLAVVGAAEKLYREYMKRETESGEYPAYKASGMAYIRFAKEERELFKMLYMRDRSHENTAEGAALFEEMETLVHNNIGLSGEDAKLFHLEIWAYVHGIATMFATEFLNLEWELVSRMLTDAYVSLKKRYETE